MHLIKVARSAVLCALLISGAAARGTDWPQWLGPNRDSIWTEAEIIDRFPAGGPPLRWRTQIGSGYAGPVVAKGRVYLMDRLVAKDASHPSDPFERGSITGGERVVCLNEADGKQLWQHQYECPYTVS